MRFSNYYNYEGRNRNIYSRNNLLNMSLKEMLERELELAYQYNTIGIPNDDDLMTSPYAQEYTDEQGIKRWQAGAGNEMSQNVNNAPLDNMSEPTQSAVQGLGNSAPEMDSQTSLLANNSATTGSQASGLSGFGQEDSNINSPKVDLSAGNNSGAANSAGLQNGSRPVAYNSQFLYNPYLEQANQFRIEPKSRVEGVPTGGAAAVKHQVNWDKNGKVYYTDENGRKVNPNLLEKSQYAIEDLKNQGFNKNDKMNMQEELQNYWDILINNKTDYIKQITPKEKFLDAAIKSPITRACYPIASDFYTNAANNFSRARKDSNANVVENMSVLDAKTQGQLKKYKIKDTDPGVIYNENSEVSKILSKSPEVKKILKENIDAIKDGTLTSAKIDFEANLLDAIFNHEKFDRYNSIQHAVLNNIKYNEADKSFTYDLKDRYDYERRMPKKALDIVKTYFNNFGYNMQEKENLQNYFTQINMKTNEESLDKELEYQLLEKLKRKILRKTR